MMKKIRFIAASLFLLCAGAYALPATANNVVGAPVPWHLNLQPAASPIKEKMHDFHDLLLVIIIAITMFVLALLVFVAVRFSESANPVPSKTTHNTTLEIIWTAIPVLILVVIAVPSFRLLYYADKIQDADMTIKVVGHQWYWSYEYPDHGDIAFDSYMIPDDEIDASKGQLRLLEVDNRLVLPVETNIRVLITSADVLHSWAIPSLGIKKDSIPGRLNETWLRINQEGVYYGQCSEICGSGHGFMPIAIEAVSRQKYIQWVNKMGGSMPEISKLNDSEPKVNVAFNEIEANQE